MSCLHEAHLSDEKLIGFALDGEALPEDAQHHLEHCAECQQRIAHYKKFHDGLVARFYHSQCQAGTDLRLYTMGLLRQKERQRIANHLVDCPLCSIEVEKTYSFMQRWPVPTSVLMGVAGDGLNAICIDSAIERCSLGKAGRPYGSRAISTVFTRPHPRRGAGLHTRAHRRAIRPYHDRRMAGR